MSDSTIVKTIFLKADAETVWEFLTDKDKLGEWFHPANSELSAGNDYVLKGAADDGSKVRKCWGSVLEAERPEKLVYTFTIEPLGGVMTTVTWLLQEVHGGTRLMLQHEGIEAAAGDMALPLLMALDAGWDAHLGRLRDYAE
jgi:uncharacterized protein YndB with AHSA1/START domain